jgi:hypothetical protein
LDARVAGLDSLALREERVNTIKAKQQQYDEGAIFERAWESAGELNPAIARYVLRLGFSDSDRDRMHELARKNRSGELTVEEADILDGFIRVGDLIAILQSKARRYLSKKSARNGRHE